MNWRILRKLQFVRNCSFLAGLKGAKMSRGQFLIGPPSHLLPVRSGF